MPFTLKPTSDSNPVLTGLAPEPGRHKRKRSSDASSDRSSEHRSTTGLTPLRDRPHAELDDTGVDGPVKALKTSKAARAKNRSATTKKTVNSPLHAWQPKDRSDQTFALAIAAPPKHRLGYADEEQSYFAQLTKQAAENEFAVHNAKPNVPKLVAREMDVYGTALLSQPAFEDDFGGMLDRAADHGHPDVQTFGRHTTTLPDGSKAKLAKGVFTVAEHRDQYNVSYKAQDAVPLAERTQIYQDIKHTLPTGRALAKEQKKLRAEHRHLTQMTKTHQYVFKTLREQSTLLSDKLVPGRRMPNGRPLSWKLQFSSDAEMESFFKAHFLTRKSDRLPELTSKDLASAMVDKAIMALSLPVHDTDLPPFLSEERKALSRASIRKDRDDWIRELQSRRGGLNTPDDVRALTSTVLSNASVDLTDVEKREVRADKLLQKVPNFKDIMESAVMFKSTVADVAENPKFAGKTKRFVLPDGSSCNRTANGGLSLESGDGKETLEVSGTPGAPDFQARITIRERNETEVDPADTAAMAASLQRAFGDGATDVINDVIAVAHDENMLKSLGLPSGYIVSRTASGNLLLSKGHASAEITLTAGAVSGMKITELVEARTVSAYKPDYKGDMQLDPDFNRSLEAAFPGQILDGVFRGRNFESIQKSVSGKGTVFDQVYGQTRAVIAVQHNVQKTVYRHVSAKLKETIKAAEIQEVDDPSAPGGKRKIKVPIIGILGVGHSYNKVLYGTNPITDHRPSTMDAAIELAHRNLMMVFGSCGTHQEHLWNAGGHIVAYQDDGEVYRWSKHGGDPYVGEDKPTFMRLRPYTHTAGNLELPRILAQRPGAKAITVWPDREDVALQVPIAGVGSNQTASLLKGRDGRQIEASKRLKLETGVALDNSSHTVAEMFGERPPAAVGEEELSPGIDPLKYKTLKMGEDTAEGMVLADDLGRAILDENGKEVTRPQELTLEATLNGKPLTQAEVDARRTAIQVRLMARELDPVPGPRPTDADILAETDPSAKKRLIELQARHDRMPPTLAEIQAEADPEARARKQQFYDAYQAKSLTPEIAAAAEKLLKGEVTYVVSQAERWERVMMSEKNARGQWVPVKDDNGKILHTYRKVKIPYPTPGELVDYDTVPIHCVHGQNGINHRDEEDLMALHGDYRTQLTGAGAPIEGPDNDPAMTSNFRPAGNFWMPKAMGLYTPSDQRREALTNEAAEDWTGNIVSTQWHIDMALGEAKVPGSSLPNDPLVQYTLTGKIRPENHSHRQGLLPNAKRAIQLNTYGQGLVKDLGTRLEPVKDQLDWSSDLKPDERPSAENFNRKLPPKDAGATQPLDRPALLADLADPAGTFVPHTLTMAQLAELTPEERRRYDAEMASVRAMENVPNEGKDITMAPVSIATHPNPFAAPAAASLTGFTKANLDRQRAEVQAVYRNVPQADGKRVGLRPVADRLINPIPTEPTTAPQSDEVKAAKRLRKVVDAGTTPAVNETAPAPKTYRQVAQETRDVLAEVKERSDLMMKLLAAAELSPDERKAKGIDLNDMLLRVIKRNPDEGARMNLITPSVGAFASLGDGAEAVKQLVEGGMDMAEAAAEKIHHALPVDTLLGADAGVLAMAGFGIIGGSILTGLGIQIMKGGQIDINHHKKMMVHMKGFQAQVETALNSVEAEIAKGDGNDWKSAETLKKSMEVNAAHMKAAVRNLDDAKFWRTNGALLTLGGASTIAGAALTIDHVRHHIHETLHGGLEQGLAAADAMKDAAALDPTSITTMVVAASVGGFALRAGYKNHVDGKDLEGMRDKVNKFYMADTVLNYGLNNILYHEEKARQADRLPLAALAGGSIINVGIGIAGVAGAKATLGASLAASGASLLLAYGTYRYVRPTLSKHRTMRQIASVDPTKGLPFGMFDSDRHLGLLVNKLSNQSAAWSYFDRDLDEEALNEAMGGKGFTQHKYLERLNRAENKVLPDVDRTKKVRNMTKHPEAVRNNNLQFMLRMSQPEEAQVRHSLIPMTMEKIAMYMEDHAMALKEGKLELAEELMVLIDAHGDYLARQERKLERLGSLNTRLLDFTKYLDKKPEKLRDANDPLARKEYERFQEKYNDLRSDFIIAHELENLLMSPTELAKTRAATEKYLKDKDAPSDGDSDSGYESDVDAKDPMTRALQAEIDKNAAQAFDLLALKLGHERRAALEIVKQMVKDRPLPADKKIPDEAPKLDLPFEPMPEKELPPLPGIPPATVSSDGGSAVVHPTVRLRAETKPAAAESEPFNAKRFADSLDAAFGMEKPLPAPPKLPSARPRSSAAVRVPAGDKDVKSEASPGKALKKIPDSLRGMFSKSSSSLDRKKNGEESSASSGEDKKAKSVRNLFGTSILGRSKAKTEGAAGESIKEGKAGRSLFGKPKFLSRRKAGDEGTSSLSSQESAAGGLNERQRGVLAEQEAAALTSGSAAYGRLFKRRE